MLRGLVSISASNATWFGINISLLQMLRGFINISFMLREYQLQMQFGINIHFKCYVVCGMVWYNISFKCYVVWLVQMQRVINISAWFRKYKRQMLRGLVSISASNATWSGINISFKCYVVWYQYQLQMLLQMVLLSISASNATWFIVSISTSASNATWFGINISFKCYVVWYQNQHQMLRDLVSINFNQWFGMNNSFAKCYVV